jgi:hypothetical protein
MSTVVYEKKLFQCCLSDLFNTYSRGQNKVGQCFFANVNLLALSMVTMKIFIYFIIVTPVYSTQFWLNFLIRLVLLYFGRHCNFPLKINE